MLSVAVFVVAIAAIPAVLILGLLVVLGSIVAALTDDGLSIVRPPQS